MKSKFALAILSVVAVLSASPLQAARSVVPSSIQLTGGETREQIQEAYTKAITALAPDLVKADGAPLRAFESLLHNAARPGAEAERLACGKAVAAALLTDAPAEAKAWMLKLSSFAGGEDLVSSATRLLEDKEPLVRESARYALQHIPLASAAAALRAALGKTSEPSWQAALALALGARKDTASVPALTALLQAKDAAVVEAALQALGDIANADAARALAAAQKTVAASLRVTAAEAWAKCAERAVRDGNLREAETIYAALAQPSQSRVVRLAGLAGSLKAAGRDAGTKVLELLQGTDADARAVALGAIPDLDGTAMTALANGIPRLPSEMQPMLLAMLAERGVKQAYPIAVEFAKSPQEALRVAGLNAMGRIGNAGSVAILIPAMAEGGSVGAAARDALTRLEDYGVADHIIAAMKKDTDAARRTTLIEVLEARGAALAVPALLEVAGNDAGNARRAAVRALGKLASTQELPALLKLLLKAAPGGERDDAERAVAAICARSGSGEKQIDPVLAAYATADSAGKPALLPLLGRLGGGKSFELVKNALAGNDPALQKAGESALLNWPDADDNVEAELLTLAQRSQKPSERNAALRAYIRVIALPSGLPEKTRLARFQKAMDLAGRDDERNLVLERLSDIKHIETLRFVVPHLDQPSLAARAGNTVCELAKEAGLRSRNKTEFENALNKIVAVCKDPAVVDRAKRRLAEK